MSQRTPTEPKTPPKQAGELQKIQTTPNSYHSNSYIIEGTAAPLYVPDVERHLKEDVQKSLVVPIESFIKVVLDMHNDGWVPKYLSQRQQKIIEGVFAELVSTATDPGKEEELYPSIVNLCNGAGNQQAIKNNDKKLFYVQDPCIVRGYMINLKPDLSAIYRRLLSGEKNLKETEPKNRIAENMVFGLMLLFFEIKKENGSALGYGPKREQKSIPDKVEPTKSSTSGSRREQKSAVLEQQPEATRQVSGPSASDRVTRSMTRSRSEIDSPDPAGGPDEPEEPDPAVEELMLSKKRRDLTLQCARYGKALLSTGLVRSHGLGMAMDAGTNRILFQLQYYDHSLLLRSKPIDLKIPQLKNLFIAIISRVLALSQEELGILPQFNPNFFAERKIQTMGKRKGRVASGKKKNVAGKGKGRSVEEAPNPKTLEGTQFSLIFNGDIQRDFIVERLIYKADGILGRGSTILLATCEEDGGGDWTGKQFAVKLSFPAETRQPEHVLVNHALDLATNGHKWALLHLPHIYDCLTIPFAEGTVQYRLKQAIPDYEERVLRIMVSEPLYSLNKLKSAEEAAQVFYDILHIHHWLYEDAKIFHRDLSMGNIMFRRQNGKVYGVLNDFDLSSSLPLKGQPSSNWRTGTRPYMAYDLLNPKWYDADRGPLYRHDLESLFFIMVILSCHYGSPSQPLAFKKRPFNAWFSADDFTVSKEKLHFLTENGPLPIQEYFESFRTWLEPIRDCFGVGYALRSALRSRESNAEEQETLLGNVTYAKMDEIMCSFGGRKLEKRSPFVVGQ
ncbi:hypothetical protein D9757_012647 [Collybiopsis confluens]|uniref:Protein kinase domain-containing protein n=1 Tax=Collybiopsis confluens TaxID=2823264 RepID=A0A8H5D6K7_9AGAR|nr:hypothetical protein D9757_012647 [Collybiopsis confluens]